MFYGRLLTCLSRCARKLFIEDGTHLSVFKKKINLKVISQQLDAFFLPNSSENVP